MSTRIDKVASGVLPPLLGADASSMGPQKIRTACREYTRDVGLTVGRDEGGSAPALIPVNAYFDHLCENRIQGRSSVNVTEAELIAALR